MMKIKNGVTEITPSLNLILETVVGLDFKSCCRGCSFQCL